MTQAINSSTNWVDIWSPKSISEMILPDNIIRLLTGYISNGCNQNLLIYGQPGCGKTSIARIIEQELQSSPTAYCRYINCRNPNLSSPKIQKILNCKASIPAKGKKMIFILDEFDNLSRSIRDDFRGLMDRFPDRTYILISNVEPKKLDTHGAIKSRVPVIDMNMEVFVDIENCLWEKTRKHLVEILDIMKCTLPMDKFELALESFPDIRSVIGTAELWAQF